MGLVMEFKVEFCDSCFMMQIPRDVSLSLDVCGEVRWFQLAEMQDLHVQNVLWGSEGAFDEP